MAIECAAVRTNAGDMDCIGGDVFREEYAASEGRFATDQLAKCRVPGRNPRDSVCVTCVQCKKDYGHIV